MYQGLIPLECRLFLLQLTKIHPSLTHEKVIEMIDNFSKKSKVPLPGVSKEKLKLTGKGKKLYV